MNVPFEIAMSGPSPLEQFQSREDCAEVGEVLLKLEPSYREVLVLRVYEELSLEEIANVTKAPLSTVKSRLYRGLAAVEAADGTATCFTSISGGGGHDEELDKSLTQDGDGLKRAVLSGANTAARASVVNRTHRGGAGAGQDDGSAAEQGAQPLDSAGCLFLSSGDYLHGGLECIRRLRCDAEWCSGCEQSVPGIVFVVSSGFHGVTGSGIVPACAKA